MIIAQVERPNVDCRARQVPSVSKTKSEPCEAHPATALVVQRTPIPSAVTLGPLFKLEWYSIWTDADDGKRCDKERSQCKTHNNSMQRLGTLELI